MALGAGAARCAIAPQEGAQDSPQEQEQPAPAGADAATGKAASGAEALWNTAWTGADDPTATLRIVEGAMVESSGGTERAWFFSAEEPSEAGGVLSVPIDVKGTKREAGRPLAHPGLGRRGRPHPGLRPPDAGVHAPEGARRSVLRDRHRRPPLRGVGRRLAADIEDVVARKAAEVSPQVASASWDKEVWLDYAGNVASTTFTLDDPASTVVTVVSRGGSLEAM